MVSGPLDLRSSDWRPPSLARQPELARSTHSPQLVLQYVSSQNRPQAAKLSSATAMAGLVMLVPVGLAPTRIGAMAIAKAVTIVEENTRRGEVSRWINKLQWGWMIANGIIHTLVGIA